MNALFKKILPAKEDLEDVRMCRRHTRELLKLVKQNQDFSSYYLDEFVHMKIKHMYEYFSTSNDIWQTEENRVQIVEQLQHVLDLWKEMESLWEDYNKNIIRNEDGTIAKNKSNAMRYLEVLAREGELYKEIYSYIGEWIQFWED